MPEASITTDSLTDYRYIFQANYKDTRLALIKTAMLFFVVDFQQLFVPGDIFKQKFF